MLAVVVAAGLANCPTGSQLVQYLWLAFGWACVCRAISLPYPWQSPRHI